MQEPDDNTLLREYAERGSHEAFATLVARHVDKVYSVALRHTRNPGNAEEITQVVFIILAQKAKKLHQRPGLSGWLYQTARLTAVTFIRSEIRRAKREQEAYMQSTSDESPPAIWEELSPLIDDAIGRLDIKDRDALVLRFLDGKSMQEVGAGLGASEDAAKMRVSRALDKIRKILSKRGFHCTTAILAKELSANSICVAPAMLTKSATTLALTKGAAASISTLALTKGALKIMAWTKMKTAVVVGLGVLLTTGTATTFVIYNLGKPMRSIQSEWSALSGDKSQWNWTNGMISGQSAKGDSVLASTRPYRDFTLSANVRTVNREASLAFRMQDADNGYIVIYSPDGTPCPWDFGVGHVTLVKKVSGQEVFIASYHAKKFPYAGQTAKLTVTAKGASINVSLNGLPALRVNDTTYASGFIGLRIYGDPDYPCDATFSQVSFH